MSEAIDKIDKLKSKVSELEFIESVKNCKYELILDEKTIVKKGGKPTKLMLIDVNSGRIVCYGGGRKIIHYMRLRGITKKDYFRRPDYLRN